MHCYIERLGVEGIVRYFFGTNTQIVANTCFLVFLLRRFYSDKYDLTRILLRYLHKKWRVEPLDYIKTVIHKEHDRNLFPSAISINIWV